MLPQVVYTRGPLLWQGFTVLGNALSRRKLAPRRNAPSQEYNPANRSVVNRASIYGNVSVEASGTYTPQVGVTHIRLAYFIKLAATCCHAHMCIIALQWEYRQAQAVRMNLYVQCFGLIFMHAQDDMQSSDWTFARRGRHRGCQ